MHLTITSTSPDAVFPLEVPDDLDLANLKAFCEAQTDIPAVEMVVIFNGKPLEDDSKSIKDLGLKDGEMVVVERKRKKKKATAAGKSPGGGGMQLPNFDFGQIRVPGQSGSSPSPSTSTGGGGGGGGGGGHKKEEDPQFILDMLKKNPDQLAHLRQNNPALADAMDKGLDEFAKVLKDQQKERRKREEERMRMLTADPFDMEAQRLIALEIENKNIEHNMELAMEYNPESFGSVIMLYIDCKVNGHPIKAFVDSGAQATIMSQVELVFNLDLLQTPHS
jgi:DNA damage-inducible protein 1